MRSRSLLPTTDGQGVSAHSSRGLAQHASTAAARGSQRASCGQFAGIMMGTLCCFATALFLLEYYIVTKPARWSSAQVAADAAATPPNAPPTAPPPPPPLPGEVRAFQHAPEVDYAALAVELGISESERAARGIAVMSIAHNRPDKLLRQLREFALMPAEDREGFTFYVSLDVAGSRDKYAELLRDPETGGVVRRLLVMPDWFVHSRAGSPGFVASFHLSPLYMISEHFRFAMAVAFGVLGHEKVLFIEDDLLPAPDFLQLFQHAAPLLDRDPSLFCVSSWNDNGLADIGASDTRRLMRTEFFPGLGWLTSRALWRERLERQWPQRATMGWDHHLRASGMVKGLDCVHPVVPRVQHMFGLGTNVNGTKREGDFFARYAFSSERNPDGFGDLAYLHRDAYLMRLAVLVRDAERVKIARRGAGREIPGPTLSISGEIAQGFFGFWAGLWASLRFWESSSSNTPQPSSSSQPPVARLVTFERYNYVHVLMVYRIWTQESRSYIRGITELPNYFIDGGTLLLAEKRDAAELLRPEEGILRRPDLLPTIAQKGESCADACARISAGCDVMQLPYVDTCEELYKAFPCEGGCTHGRGKAKDAIQPSYHLDPSAPTYLQCSRSFGEHARCAAKNGNTQRLCPCAL
jgi:hypothetical protein